MAFERAGLRLAASVLAYSSYCSRINLAWRNPVAWAFAADATSHSHTTTTFHPIVTNAADTRLSRATFFSNFSAQNKVLLFGVVAMLHSGGGDAKSTRGRKLPSYNEEIRDQACRASWPHGGGSVAQAYARPFEEGALDQYPFP